MKIFTPVRFLLPCFLFPMMLSAQLSYTVDDMLDNLNNIDLASGDVAATRVNFDNRFAEITMIASDDELAHIALTEKPLVRGYSIAALIDRKSPLLLPIFTDYTTSDTPYQGNNALTTPAAEFYKAVAKQKERVLRKAYYQRTASQAQIAELRILFGADFDTRWTISETDSLLHAFNSVAMANDNIAVETLNTIFSTNNHAVGDYARVRYFANIYPTADALAALANFKNAADVPFILQHHERSMLAISKFPHGAFMPMLQSKMPESYRTAEYQKAVAAYRNITAAKMLNSMIDKLVLGDIKRRRDNADALLQLYNVIESANHPGYESLLKRLQKY